MPGMYFTCKGEKTTFEDIRDDDNKMVGFEKHIHVLAWKLGVSAPIDIITGKKTGRRNHKTLEIEKEISSTSPLIFQALCRGEKIKEAKLTLHQTAQGGGEEVYYTISFEDCQFVEFDQWREHERSAADHGQLDHERFTMSFRKITHSEEIHKKMGDDDFSKLAST